MSTAFHLAKVQKALSLDVPLTSSKSESNRALLINQLGGNQSKLHNLSTARDTVTMARLLKSQEYELDVLDAGTVMRFMTAYLAIGKESRKISGTDRMHERPIKILVDALNALGAKVTYAGNEGFPPLSFEAFGDQAQNRLSVPGNISSQYISALLMIAPTLPKGLILDLEGEIYSRPYIEMTLNLMSHFGIKSVFEGNTVKVETQTYQGNDYTIESDWSGASYWYSLFALSDNAQIFLKGLRKVSNQGDSHVVKIMEGLGVNSDFTDEGVRLSRGSIKESMTIDFKSCPDLGQTIFACAAALGVSLEMSGLESLRIKESDRTAAMATELAKIGAKLEEKEEGRWFLSPSTELPTETVTFDTYDDHRMAMALAPLCAKLSVTIEDPMVVVKSYPEFWDHLSAAGVDINK